MINEVQPLMPSPVDTNCDSAALHFKRKRIRMWLYQRRAMCSSSMALGVTMMSKKSQQYPYMLVFLNQGRKQFITF